MGVLDRFEKGVERALSNTFARAFKADLKPVDIASAIRQEMDERAAALSKGRTVVPNHFVIEIGPTDRELIQEWGMDALASELAGSATDHATDQGYVFVGPVEVEFADVNELKAGQFQVRSDSRRAQPGAAPSYGYGGTSSPVPREDAPVAAAPVEPTPMPESAATPPPAPTRSQPILDVDGQRYLLTGAVTIIGRGSEADIIVNDSGVSRAHLEIRITPDGIIATDLGSTNGSFVEGHRVGAATLVDGNTLTVGRTRIIFWSGEGSDA